MSLNQIKTYVSHKDWEVSYEGRVIYDFKASFTSNLKPGYYPTLLGKSRVSLNITPHNHKKLCRYTKGLHEKYTPEDFYYYFLVDRIRTGISPTYTPEIAKFICTRMSDKLKFTISKLVEMLLKSYSNVITDIPGVGGVDISNIHKVNESIWYGNYNEIHEALPQLISKYNLTPIPSEPKKDINIILMFHHPELAFELTKFIPNSLPISMISKGIYYP